MRSDRPPNQKGRLRRLSGWTLLGAFLLLAPTQDALAQLAKGENGLGVAMKGLVPTGKFRGTSDFGVGFAVVDGFRISEEFSVGADFSFYSAFGKGQSESLQFMGGQLGGYYHGGPVFVGVDAGYFFGKDIQNEFDVLLAVGYEAEKLEIAFHYNFLGEVNWVGLRLGYYLAVFGQGQK